MRIKQAHLLIVGEDLTAWLARLLPASQVSDLRIATLEGSLRATCRYKFGFMNIPVDVAVQVTGLNADTLDLTVRPGGGGDASFVSEVLLGLLAGGRVTGVRVVGNTVRVDIRSLTAALGVPCRLEGLRITTTGITLAVADLVLPQPPPEVRTAVIRGS